MTDVKGYRELTDDEKNMANMGKELEERMLRYFDLLEQSAKTDKRCVALAKTNIQQGLMWAIRSIFQPQRIRLPEDA